MTSGNITSQRNFVMYRGEIGTVLPYSVFPALSVNIGGKVGGDINIDMAPKTDVNKRTVELYVNPKMNLVGNVEATVAALFASAGAEGTVQIVNSAMPISGGATSMNRGVGPFVRFNDLEVKALGGKVDLIATLSLGNALPPGLQKYWKLAFGNGRKYSYTLVDWEGMKRIPISGVQFPRN